MFELDNNAREAGVTVVENLFIRQYLPAAKGDYVKVYLWGLYLTQHPQSTYGVHEMAADLEMTVPQVESALRYWERRALVTCVSRDPEIYRFHSPMQRMQAGKLSDTADNEYTVFAESVYTIFGESRKVTPGEIARMWEWVQDIGLPPEAVLMLISHCITLFRSHFSMKKAESMAILMKESKVLSVEDAENFLRNDMEIHKGAQSVLRQFGRRGRLPSEDELDLYRKWRMEWQFDQDAIIAACRETTRGEPTFAYLDSILKNIASRSESRTGQQVHDFLSESQNETALAKDVMEALGLKMTVAQMLNFYREWRRQMPHDVVMMAAQLCSRQTEKTETMSQLLTSWQEKGLTTLPAVTAYADRIREIDKQLRKLFTDLGYRGKITEKDRTLYEKWVSFGFGMDILTAAAEQSHGVQGDKIRYLDSVLCAWHEAGIRDASEIQLMKKPAPADKKRPLNAQNYTQREYTEKDLTFNDAELLKEAEKYNG